MPRKTNKTGDTQSALESLRQLDRLASLPLSSADRESLRQSEKQQPATESPPLSSSKHLKPFQSSLTTPGQYNYPDIRYPGQQIPYSTDQPLPNPPRKSKRAVVLKTLKKFNCFACFNHANPLSPADRKPLSSSSTTPSLSISKHPEQTPKNDNRSLAAAGDLHPLRSPAREDDDLNISELPVERVLDVSTEQFMEKVKESSMALVMFHDTRVDMTGEENDWAMQQFYKSASVSEQGFFTVDCSVEEELCDRYHINKVPQFKLYSRGGVVETVKIFPAMDEDHKDRYMYILGFMEKYKY